MTRRIIRTATTAIALMALAAPTALARPADIPPAVAKAAAAAQHEQDLRAPDAVDAATSHKQAGHAYATSGHPYATSGYPTRPPQGEQISPRPDTPPQAPADPSVAWKLIGLGIAGILAAAIAVLVSRTRRSWRSRIA